MSLGGGVVACQYNNSVNAGALASLSTTSMSITYFPQRGTIEVLGGSLQQMELIKEFIAKNGGLVIYHRQEGRNIGLVNKVNAYALQDKGRNTIEANVELGFKEDERDYRVVGYIFENLGIKKLKLITNNPAKLKYVESLGVEIVERIPAIIKANKYNELYLSTKKEKMGHLI
jgi:GTP cyclohydrolase II